VQNAFGQDLPVFQGKDVKSLFYLHSAMPPSRKPGLTYIFTHLQIDYIWKPLILQDNKDSQTALRIANEMADKAIQTTKAVEAQGGVSENQ
jgi:multiple sugar transport system substrate-binding protein